MFRLKVIQRLYSIFQPQDEGEIQQLEEACSVNNLILNKKTFNRILDYLAVTWKMVPGGGIEPPTRGFSIHCSTPELPGHGERRAARVALF